MAGYGITKHAYTGTDNRRIIVLRSDAGIVHLENNGYPENWIATLNLKPYFRLGNIYSARLLVAEAERILHDPETEWANITGLDK